MKVITAFVVAAALAAPQAALAQRHTTPGQAERHKEAQEKSDEKDTKKDYRSAESKADDRDQRIPAAKAGKVNLAAPASGSPN